MSLPRCSGILLHPTSFPGPYGIGDIGAEAEDFVDFLGEAGQRIWQVLPLGPTGYGDSPYQSYSSFAGNPLLINLEGLLEDGLLGQEDLENRPPFPEDRVDFGTVIGWKNQLLRRAYDNFRHRAGGEEHRAFETFCAKHAAWLDDFALFMALKETRGQTSWAEWAPDLALRKPMALDAARKELVEGIEAHKFIQYQFARQWDALHAYAGDHGILLVGDIPFYVAHDSADVWANPGLFRLDAAGHATAVAGVPPDYFSATGQLWGNPIYRWDVLAASGFDWWVRRVRAALDRVDVVRIDHFRGFEAYWEVAAGEPTAVNGRWVKGPREALFEALRTALGEDLPIIAENLGMITPEVEALRERFGLPGMAVFQFGFGTDARSSAFPLHAYQRDLVAYTGTHDNDTLAGWWESLRRTRKGRAIRRYLRKYLAATGRDFPWACIRSLMASVADVVVFPVQDVLGLGSDARMNRPGSPSGNWVWRMRSGALTPELAERLKELADIYGRTAE